MHMNSSILRFDAISRRLRPAAAALVSGLMLATASSALLAWDKWDAFKASNVNDGFRVVDYSDSRSITTSEGQSYAMFFALVAGDKDSFAKLLKWTENNLAKGDITKNKPAWLWGKNGSSWGIIDTNNAADSDMWIAYNLLEAGRLWEMPEYTAKGRAMMDLLKKDVRDVKGLGKVLLPGCKGFEQDAFVTLNPSYYPVFVMRRFALEDPEWNRVVEGTVRALVRSAPRGFAPDWVRFDRQGRVMPEKGDDYVLGSYNAIRAYMWAAMMSEDDPVRKVLTERFMPFAEVTAADGMPPEKINILTGKKTGTGSTGFAACVLELMGPGAMQDYLRTVIENDQILAENYYRNTLLLYGIGFDRGLFKFDRNGHVILAAQTELTQVPPKAAPPVKAEEPAEEPQGEESDEHKADEAAKAAPKGEAQPAAKSGSKPEAKTEPKAEAKAPAAPAAAPVKGENAPAVPASPLEQTKIDVKPDVKAPAAAPAPAQGEAKPAAPAAAAPTAPAAAAPVEGSAK